MRVAIGSAAVERQGNDVTLISYGAMMRECRQAATAMFRSYAECREMSCAVGVNEDESESSHLALSGDCLIAKRTRLAEQICECVFCVVLILSKAPGVKPNYCI